MASRSSLLQHGRRCLAQRQIQAFRRPFSVEASSTLGSGSPRTVALAEAERPSKPQDKETSQVVTDWRNVQIRSQLDRGLGADVRPHYRPRDLINNPPSLGDLTLELLLASQSHLGHSTSVWNPSNARYIFGVRQGIHIISLDATAAHLRRAARLVQRVAESAGLILFVGTRRWQGRAVVKAAQLAEGYHIFKRWIPGSITNGQQILGQCGLKVVDHLDNEVKGFDQQLMRRAAVKPDLVVCLNPGENYTMLRECATHNIPTIGVIDTDTDPTCVTYPIPANDDSLRCAHVIAGVLGRAGEEGQRRRRQAALQGKIPYKQDKNLYEPTGSTKTVEDTAEEMVNTLFAPQDVDDGLSVDMAKR